MQWQQMGLAPPKAVTSATDAYMEAEDALTAWIEEQCVHDPQAWERTTALYAAWKAWADKSGEYAGSMKRFSQALEKRDGVTYERDRQGGPRLPRLTVRRRCRFPWGVTSHKGQK